MDVVNRAYFNVDSRYFTRDMCMHTDYTGTPFGRFLRAYLYVRITYLLVQYIGIEFGYRGMKEDIYI